MKKQLMLLLISIVLFSCGPEKIAPEKPDHDTAVEAAPKEAPVLEESEAVAIETLSEGLVVFTSGDVFVNRNGVEEYLEIGDTLVQGDVVETAEESYCEIQLGEIAIVRMEQNSIVAMRTLFTSEGGSSMSVDLEDGQVLCKVRKLLEEDSFKVKAGTVVCGVRGTEFGVSAKGEADVLLAVKEGAVAVTPASLEKVTELATGEEALDEVVGLIKKASLVVGASEEMVIEEDAFEELEEIAPAIEEVMKVLEKKNESKAAGDETAMAAVTEDVVKQAAVLKTALEETPELVAPAVLTKVEISEESLEELESTDEMELISFTPGSAEEGEEAPAPVMPELYKLNIIVEPAEAFILSNGKELARGSIKRLYADGKVLNFEFRLEGYKSQSLNLTVSSDMPGEQRIVLEPEEDLNAVLPVEEPVETPPEAVSGPVDIKISCEPSDAVLTVNGSTAEGSWSGQVEEGSSISVKAERNGFASKELTLTAAAGLNRVIRLEPRPIEIRSSLGSGNLVGELSGSMDRMIGADAKGQLTAFNASGKVLWQYQSGNTPNANSSAVIHNDRVYFSGGTELVVLNSTDGSLVAQYPLPEERSHIYGRQVMPLGDSILFPANQELVVMDRDGKDQAFYAVPETSSMSSSLWNGNIVIADKKGTLLIKDSADGRTISSIPTGSLQAVAQAPAIIGNRAVFASRKGIVSAVDLASGSVLWERKLDRTVFANIIATNEGCYVYTTKRELFALSWDSGDDLFPALSDISAVPGYDKGRLYMTDRSGVMKVINASSGKVEGSLNLNDSFTAKPIIRNGILIGVGTNGNFFRINTEGIR